MSFGWKRMALWTGVTVAAVSVAAGGYFLFRKFERDRASAMNFREMPPPNLAERTTTDGRATKTYTQKDIEEARRKGQRLPGQPYTPPQSTTANDAAIQRQLQTLQEINRINELNQRLQDQQQRMQRQNK